MFSDNINYLTEKLFIVALEIIYTDYKNL
jgi:hypothetical protein